MWMQNRQVQKLGGGRLEKFGVRLWSQLQFGAIYSRKERAVYNLLRQVQRDRRTLLTAFEGYLVYSSARAQEKRPGAFAEVGVFQGGSARIICEAKGDRRLDLFDTFEGLPATTDKDAGVHQANQYTCSLESVQEYLKNYPNVHYHKGLFPDSTHDVPEQTYAFAHFDVDLYASTRACLEYFYPRMIPGGIMLSHDYDILEGVKQAFQEFFADKPETIIEQPTTQCVVVKIG